MIREFGLTDIQINELTKCGEWGLDNGEELKTFEDLEVWQACRNLRMMLRSMVKKFPFEEKSRLADQIVRAASQLLMHWQKVTADTITRKLFSFAVNAVDPFSN